MREPDYVDECYADKDLSLLKKLTLVIPTYNRNYYLSRCLWYHAHFPFGEIIVADSSPEEKKGVNRETVQKVREIFGANIQYLEYEPETEKYGGDIYKKWENAISYSITEYTQICADKEFLLPDTLLILIEIMDRDSEIGACGTNHIQAELNNTNKLFFSRASNDIGEYSTPKDINDRIEYVRRNKIPMGVLPFCRTVVYNQVYDKFSKYITDIRFGEYAIGLAIHLLSRIHYIGSAASVCRDLTFLRKNGCVIPSESSARRYPLFEEYKSLKIYDDFYNNFKEYLNTINNFEKQMSSNQFDKWFICYLRNTGIIPSTKLETTYRKVLLLMHRQRITEIIYRFICVFWSNIPIHFKQVLMKKIGIYTPNYVQIISPELALIQKIICKTRVYHDKDEPITLK
ncbi:MAG: TIGR00180 family glycosyltransferase [Dysgonamonadaceae bacterium]|nr:TIGR00180 family glycosyltransferase [Dysgonamonadaceae bacterium]MDD3901878.1 TIGR00180 family glycosyltransferase [Dysgonamonadaceae bacterium]